MFTQEGETVKELTPDGVGGFDSLEEPGQTFYFSRVLPEEVDSPTLRLDTGNSAVTVFLDGSVLYTDCPELVGRIGYLRLPMLEWCREEPVLVTLPQNYAGKTLTVAQSTDPSGGELSEPTPTVCPCAVTLYCGYAYESELVAESFQAAVPAALAFAAMALLLALLAAQTLRGKPDLGTLCGALLAFFWLARRLDLPVLPNASLGPLPVDAAGLARELSLTLLLVFLASRMTGWRRWAAGLFVLAQGMTVAVHTALNAAGQLTFFWVQAVSVIGLAGLAAALVCGVLEWKRSWFFRCFCPLTAALAIAWTALGLWKYSGLSILDLLLFPLTLLPPLTGIMTAAALATALAEAARREITRRTEARLLIQRGELAQSGYEALRRQNEQVMMLRHDMMKHFQVLRQTTADEKTAAYLDGLIGENEKIRPMVQSGNGMLDVILNGKLSAAADAGIEVELARTKAPDKLPLTDAELCSLMMNLLDNALEAAAAAGVKRRYLKLDMNVRNGYFVFTCENGATLDWMDKDPAPGRGLGLKVIRQIVERYGNLMDTEHGEDYYRVTVLLPLRQSRK